MLERAQRHEETVCEAVEEEEDEVLVVVEGDAVVDPGAVMIHLEHAASAHGAVMRAVRLHTRALLTVAHRALQIATLNIMSFSVLFVYDSSHQRTSLINLCAVCFQYS